MARVMPLLLTMKRWPVPDLDAVFSGTDYPIMEIPRDPAHMQRMYGPGQPIPPVFSPTANTVTHDLPWPDFSFFPPLGRCGKPCSSWLEKASSRLPRTAPPWACAGHPRAPPPQRGGVRPPHAPASAGRPRGAARLCRHVQVHAPAQDAALAAGAPRAPQARAQGGVGGQDRARRLHGQHEDLAQPAADLPPGARRRAAPAPAAPPRRPPRRPGARRPRRRAHSAPAPGARAFTGRTPRLSARAAAALLSPPQAEQMPELLFVNEVYIKTSPPSCFAINEPNVTKGGTLVKKCGLSFEEMCRCH